MYRQFSLVALLSFFIVPFAVAELQSPNGLERTQCKFKGNADVTVEYSSMLMNGRKIFGGLVPYGRVWVTSDSRSPTFVTSGNLVVGGKEVPAGHYSLTTIPNSSQWTLLLKKTTSEDSPNRTDEVASIGLTVRRLRSPIQSFAISFDQFQDGCVLNLKWEETEASVLLTEKK